jgi:hypothetical protein
MLPKTLIKGFDKGRLKGLLAVFFLALAVPTGALIWQAYSQLKWEAFHQHRGLAESLTGRVDAQLTDMINAADARSFADYTFLNVTGETKYNFVGNRRPAWRHGLFPGRFRRLIQYPATAAGRR